MYLHERWQYELVAVMGRTAEFNMADKNRFVKIRQLLQRIQPRFHLCEQTHGFFPLLREGNAMTVAQ